MTIALLAIGVGLAALAFRKPLAKWQADQVLREPRNWGRPFDDGRGWFEVLVVVEGAAWIALGVALLAR